MRFNQSQIELKSNSERPATVHKCLKWSSNARNVDWINWSHDAMNHTWKKKVNKELTRKIPAEIQELPYQICLLCLISLQILTHSYRQEYMQTWLCRFRYLFRGNDGQLGLRQSSECFTHAKHLRTLALILLLGIFNFLEGPFHHLQVLFFILTKQLNFNRYTPNWVGQNTCKLICRGS